MYALRLVSHPPSSGSNVPMPRQTAFVISGEAVFVFVCVWSWIMRINEARQGESSHWLWKLA